MDITITVSTTELSPADKILIKDCLGITEPQWTNAIKRLGKAAFMEYVKMFKEKGLPTRADEVQQERLFFLLNHYYVDHVPGENEVSSIFQLTPAQSRTLLRNTKSRYRTKITNFIKKTLRDTLTSAVRPAADQHYEFVCTSPTIVEELNSIVSQKGGTLEPIIKIRGLASKYKCAADTYNLLHRELRE